MAKLTLTNGTIFEGTTEEIFAITERFNGVKADEPTAESPYELKVGDSVEILDNRASEYKRPTRITAGEITDIDFSAKFADYPYRVDGAGTFDRFPASALRKVVDKPKAEALKVGDYAKVIDLAGSESSTIVGDIVKVDKTETDRFVYYTVLRNGKRSGMFAKRFVKATDEEVTEAKAKAEASAEQARKEAVFTQVGRKPNEYRKGDIVEFTNDYTAIGVVEDVGDRLIGVRTEREKNSYQLPYKTEVKPITFVESRLDRN